MASPADPSGLSGLSGLSDASDLRQPWPQFPAAGAITDVPGIKVGHYTDHRRPTGCTVILTETGATGGVDVRGSAPGTRETDLLAPVNTIERVHAVLLTGGSAFGLDAAGGVMRWLDEHGFGVAIGPARVPIVPAAVLFDLLMGDSAIRPDAAAGYAACEAACGAPGTQAPAEGSIGAGTGALVGKLFGLHRAMKGGLGTASIRIGDITVGAIVAVNAIGDVIDPTQCRLIAGARSADGLRIAGTTASMLRGDLPPPMQAGMATTIGVIATDAVLTKAQAQKLAQSAHDGFARTIDPAHTAFDGDTIFALATGRSGLPGNPLALGAMAAHVMASAVVRAVLRAEQVRGAAVPAIPTAAQFAAVRFPVQRN